MLVSVVGRMNEHCEGEGGNKMWLCLSTAFHYSLFLLTGLSVMGFGGCFLGVKEAAALLRGH